MNWLGIHSWCSAVLVLMFRGTCCTHSHHSLPVCVCAHRLCVVPPQDSHPPENSGSPCHSTARQAAAGLSHIAVITFDLHVYLYMDCVVCQMSYMTWYMYAPSLLMRANKLEAVVQGSLACLAPPCLLLSLLFIVKETGVAEQVQEQVSIYSGCHGCC